MAGTRSTYTYTSDDGADYIATIDSSNALAAGFTPQAGNPNLPRSYHMRYVLGQHPTTGRERKVYVPTADHALYVGGTTSVTITDFTTTPSAQVSYAVKGRIGERRLGR